MGGNIKVKSKIGKGTVFKIELTTLCRVDDISMKNFEKKDLKLDLNSNTSDKFFKDDNIELTKKSIFNKR